MKRVTIGGIGNVLLGDDGVGPYVVRLLAAEYEFEEGVEILDLGTPALDLVDCIAEKDAVILVDAVETDGEPGSIVLYSKEDIVKHGPSPRIDQHSPALVDAILGAEVLGTPPKDVVLIGIVPETFEPGCTLSEAVQRAVRPAIEQTLQKLEALGVRYERRSKVLETGIWWTETPEAASA